MKARLRQFAVNNRLVRLLYRLGTVLRSRGALLRRPRQSLRYVFRSHDVMHFTYELSNEAELVRCLSDAFGFDPSRVAQAFTELKTDSWLHRGLGERLRAHPRRDDEVHFGYRLGTYAICRLAKPLRVAELGTHDGLQTAVLLRALERNAEEGVEGLLMSFDANPESGWLIPDRLRERFSHVVGDLGETLVPALREHGVDFLMQDVGYAYPGNKAAYSHAVDAAERGLLVFAEVDSAMDLLEIANERGAGYTSFRERPLDHFWHGQRWGLASFSGPENSPAHDAGTEP